MNDLSKSRSRASDSYTGASESFIDDNARKLRKTYRFQFQWFGYVSLVLAAIMFITSVFLFISCFFTSPGFFRVTKIVTVAYTSLTMLLFLVGYRMRLCLNFLLFIIFENTVIFFAIIGVVIIGLNCYTEEMGEMSWSFGHFVLYLMIALPVFCGYTFFANVIMRFLSNFKELAEREQAALERRFRKRKERSDKIRTSYASAEGSEGSFGSLSQKKRNKRSKGDQESSPFLAGLSPRHEFGDVVIMTPKKEEQVFESRISRIPGGTSRNLDEQHHFEGPLLTPESSDDVQLVPDDDEQEV